MPSDFIKPRILIAGAGYSGIHILGELIKNTSSPIDIVMSEKDLSRIGGGIAYSPAAADECHQTNIAAKRMGLTAEFHGMVSPDKVAPRQLVSAFILEKLANTKDEAKRKGTTIRFVQGEVIDLIETGQGLRAQIAGHSDYSSTFDSVIIASGNSDLKRLPCITDYHMSDTNFLDYYIEDQWSKVSKNKIASIPKDEPVLILGTGLSAYDAVRSLLRNGHYGQITMMSRNGLEHFKYPENHTWEDVHLPRPRFMNFLMDPEKVKQGFVQEFYALTGIEVDLDAMTYQQRDIIRAGPDGTALLSEQVLKSWERFVPEIIDTLGPETSREVLKRYSSLINVLRVGAGKEVCDEMQSAKARGQLFTIAADIHGMSASNDGITIDFTRKGSVHNQCMKFYNVISALGYDFSYKNPKTELWRNMMARGYTQPHALGIGVNVLTNEDDFGRLDGCRSIYAVGAPIVGARMTKYGIIGPPAYSIPGTRDMIAKTGKVVARELSEQFRFYNPNIAFIDPWPAPSLVRGY